MRQQLTVKWKKAPSDPNWWPQWNSITHDACIRHDGLKYSAFYLGKCLGSFLSLRTAKIAIEHKVCGHEQMERE